MPKQFGALPVIKNICPGCWQMWFRLTRTSDIVGVIQLLLDPNTERKLMQLQIENLENITKQLLGAANSRNICSLKLAGENGYRTVHVHGIFMAKQGTPTILCWQKSGYSKRGSPEGYKNLVLERCENVLVLSRKFVKRRDFNPQDGKYGEWLFHI